MTTPPIDRSADRTVGRTIDRAVAAFAAELGRWRTDRGLTKKQLAHQMGFDPSYLSHVERGRHRPTGDFARRAEVVLRAGGAIWRAFTAYDRARQASRLTRRGDSWLSPAGPVVDEEVARLSYRAGTYTCDVLRQLFNAGTDPVTRFLVKVSVDRYPKDPDRSARHHRERPLRLGELNLRAACGDPPEDEPMHWRTKQDRDALKELWLLFENDGGRFPLGPGQRTLVRYSFTVDDERWGSWFQRAIRLPTRRLRVELDLPESLAPQVWGVETTLAAGEVPARTLLSGRREDDDRVRFVWTVDAPALHGRYRLEWRFRPGGGTLSRR